MYALLAAFLMAQQPPCGPTGMVEKQLTEKYKESIVGAGIVNGGVLFTLVNPETGTFTILLRRPDGMTCIVMSGTGYTIQDPPQKGLSL